LWNVRLSAVALWGCSGATMMASACLAAALASSMMPLLWTLSSFVTITSFLF